MYLHLSQSFHQPLHSPFKQNLILDQYPLHALFFVLIEIEAQHITGIQVPVIEIFADLFLPIRVIPWPPPYLQLDDVLLSQVIDYDVRPGLIAGLGFDIVVPCSVDDRLQIQEKLLPPVFLLKPVLQRSINLCVRYDKAFQDVLSSGSFSCSR